MNFRTIRVGLGATIALPGYNSIRIDYSEEALVPEDEDLASARDALYDRVDSYLEDKVNEARREASGE